MSTISIDKVISILPSNPLPNTIYAVRVGIGFDLYMTDFTGMTAHKINDPVPTYNVGTAVDQTTLSNIYNAWELTDGSGYESISYFLETGDKEGVATGQLPIPADLSTLNYT